MIYGLTIENEEIILNKAKTKRDGIYMFRGVHYRVRSGLVTHFAAGGDILQRYGGYNAVVGKYQSGFGEDIEKKAILKSI